MLKMTLESVSNTGRVKVAEAEFEHVEGIGDRNGQDYVAHVEWVKNGDHVEKAVRVSKFKAADGSLFLLYLALGKLFEPKLAEIAKAAKAGK